MGAEANGMDFFHRFGGLHRYKGLLLQLCRDMGFISGVFGQGGSLRTNSAVLLRYVITAQDNKGLSVSTWRKQGGDLAPHNHAGGWKTEVIIK